jgi:hypothetical protein
MKKKLGMTLAMILLTAVAGARSSTLSPTASPALKAGTADNCPFIPANCCKFKLVGDCPVCTQTC